MNHPTHAHRLAAGDGQRFRVGDKARATISSMEDAGAVCCICTSRRGASSRPIFRSQRPEKSEDRRVLCGSCWGRWFVAFVFPCTAWAMVGMVLQTLLMLFAPLPELGEFARLVYAVPLIFAMSLGITSLFRNVEERFEAHAHKQRGKRAARASIRR